MKENVFVRTRSPSSCAHLTQVQAEKNMWDFNVIYVTAIHLRRAFMSVNVCKINSRFNFCYEAQPHGAATPCSNTEGTGWCLVVPYVGNNKVYLRYIKVMLHGYDSQRRLFAQHSVAMLEQCCNHSKQCRNHVATLCSAKNCRCESSRITSPLNLFCDKSATVSDIHTQMHEAF